MSFFIGIKYQEKEGNLSFEFICPNNYPTVIKANPLVIKH